MTGTILNIVEKKLRGHGITSTKPTITAVSGGSINQTYRVEAEHHQFFLKVNAATEFPQLFRKEAEGLSALGATSIIKTPGIRDCFEEEGWQFLLLEWIAPGERNHAFWTRFGEQLAALHQVTNSHFGWESENYMGNIPQHNRLETSWTDFFANHRLEPIFQKAFDLRLCNKRHLEMFSSLALKLPNIFDAAQAPALLHGDLWSGNFICNERSEPVLIDPAVYFGHPAVDLGMTKLFGGFHASFYKAYAEATDLSPNLEEQMAVANLYPLLVHLVLFGSSYLRQVEATLEQFA